jgi:hypothetical protein
MWCMALVAALIRPPSSPFKLPQLLPVVLLLLPSPAQHSMFLKLAAIAAESEVPNLGPYYGL